MKNLFLPFLIMSLISGHAFAQPGKLGSKILDKLAPPAQKPAEKEDVEIKQRNDGGTDIVTDEGTVTFQESTSADAVPNTFLGSFKMNIKTTDTKGKIENTAVQYHFSKWKTAMEPKVEGTEGEQMKMIMDLQLRKMTMLTVDKKGAKTGIIMKMPKITFSGDKLEEQSEQIIEGTTYKKTGEKRTIEGYLCEKWIITNEEGTSIAWITDDVDFNLSNAFGFLGASANTPGSKGKPQKGFEMMKGFSLETTHTSKKGEVSVITVTNIRIGDVGDLPFSTEGFELQDLSSFGSMFNNGQ